MGTAAGADGLTLVLESNTDRRIVEALAERFDLTILARAPRVSEFAPAPVRPVRIEAGPAGRAAYARWVFGRLRDQRGPVVVQNYGPAALAANLAARRSGARTTMVVCNPMERYYRCRPAGERRAHELAALLAIARLNGRLGQRYAVLSEHLAGVVRGHGAREVEVVPVYGVDPARFHPPAEDRAALRARLGLPADGKLVFFSSRVAPEKDPDTLLRAIAQVVTRGGDVRLLYRGRGHRELVEAAGRLGFADRVCAGDMVDPVDELPDLYRACDLCVQASREEGLGFAPLEALACGVPVVATAVGGLRETIRDGDTGWSYPVGDVAALAGAIEAALADPDEAARRAARGAAMVRERFDADAAWARFAELVTGAPAPAPLRPERAAEAPLHA